MKKLLPLAAVAALALSGCTTTERYVGGGTALGALGGAAIGAGIGGDGESALLGGALGAGAGALVGAALDPRYERDRVVVRETYVVQDPYDGYDPYYEAPVLDRYEPYPRRVRGPVAAPGPCSYRDQAGQRYIADCPPGY